MSLNLNHNLARPYAKAAFEYATEQKKTEHWAKLLSALSEYVQNEFVANILKDPHYSTEIRTKVLVALAKEEMDVYGQNFIRLLATRHRLLLLPNIYVLFQQLCAAAEKVLPVHIKTASELDEQQKENLKAKLTRLLNSEIQTDYSIDTSLLGGFIVYAGDRVMDCSVKGRLEKLSNRFIV